MDMARNTLRTLLVAAAVIAVLAEAAVAQMPMPTISLGAPEKRKLTPEEQAKQDELDQAYKSATKKIPDKKVDDPWATVRPPPPSVDKQASKTKPQ